VEQVFVTHNHGDHTDALPALVAEFGATVHACGSLVDLIERPGDYRLPCLTKKPAASPRSTRIATRPPARDVSTCSRAARRPPDLE
jgi:glyoxylase-like metal-dependent hydrolase (beta-lactamase superfamily II)